MKQKFKTITRTIRNLFHQLNNPKAFFLHFQKINLRKKTKHLIAWCVKTMPRKAVSSVVLLAIIALPLYLLFAPKAQAAWWNEQWLYRKAIAVSNTSGSNLTNQRVKITLDTATLYSAGKIKNDCADVRVTDAGGDVLDSWSTACNTAATILYVKIPNLPASGSTLYVYYGNPSAFRSEKTLGSADAPGTSCKMMKDQGSVTADGTYYIVPGGNDADKIQVYCDMTTLGGAWTLVMNSNRIVAVNPEPNWNDAVNTVNVTGTFGNNLSAFDLILGLKHWNFIGSGAMVQFGSSPLAITKRASYDAISLNATNNYALSLGTETLYLGAGTPGIKSYHSANNFQFTTYDADHDVYSANCATSYGNSPWWYGACWDGSFWGGGDSGGYQNAPFWSGSAADYNDYASISLGGTDTMKNATATLSGSEQASPGPVAYWKFDDGFGTIAQDSTAQNNDGTLTNMSATASPTSGWQTEDKCVSGKCLAFDNVDDGVSVNKNFAGFGDYTMTAWVNIKGSHKNYTGTIMSSGNWNTSQWVFGINQANTAIDLYGAGSRSYAFQLNKWTQVTVTRSGSTYTFYIDGKSIGGYSGNAAVLASDATNTMIGRETYAGGYFSFNGLIDEPKIYPYARTADQIKAEYNAGLSGMSLSQGSSVSLGDGSDKWLSDALVGYWKMDESSGNAIDASGNNNTGTWSGTGSHYPAGKFGNGGGFNGTDDYVSVPDSSSLDLTGDVTISLWVNPGSTQKAYADILSKHSNGGYVIEQNNTASNQYYFAWDTTGSGGFTGTAVQTTLNSNVWQNLTIVKSGAMVTHYVNGIQTAQGAGSSATITANNLSLKIGNLGSATGREFNGKIDETRIYNRALSPAEVAKLYDWAPGPIVDLRMDEGTGTTLNDSSGNNYNGTTYGSPAWVPGKFGKALNFSGGNYVNTAISAQTIPAFTLEAWVNPSSNGTWRAIAQTAATGDKALYLQSGYLQFYSSCNSSATVPLNQWSHVVVAVDNSNVIKYYINGNASGGCTSTNSPRVFEYLHVSGITTSDSENFQGKIDSVRLYNYARTQKQILEDMNAGNPAITGDAAASKSYWNFDEGYGTTAKDSWASNNGTISGATWMNDGRFGKALSFNGTSSYVDVGTPANLNFGTNSFSLSSWIKTTATGYQRIISNGHSGYTDGYLLQLYSGTGYISTGIGAGGVAANGLFFYSNTAVNDGLWHHVVSVFDQDVKKAKIFIDGKMSGLTKYTGTCGTVSGSVLDFTGCNSLNATSAVNFNIGRWSGASEYFNGSIDEVKIYPYALSNAEVATEFNQTKSVTMGTISAGGTNSGSRAEYCPPGNSEGNCAVGQNPAPVGEWKLDEGNGTSANDTSGNGNTGTLTNGPTWTQGKVGKGVKFDGAGDGINIPYASQYNIRNAITMSAWIKRTTVFNQLQDVHILSRPPSWYFYDSYNTGTIRGDIFIDGVRQGGLTTPVPFDGNWYQVTYTYDSNSHVANIYRNGILTSTTTLTSLSNYLIDASTANFITTGLSNLGRGLIFDNVRIYNYARTPAQVSWDYNKGAPVGWWKLDECQGTAAYDNSGNGNNGTITIGASGTQTAAGTCQTSSTAWGNGATGKWGSSLSFDGTDDYVVSVNSVDMVQNSFSASAWFKTTSSADAKIISNSGSYHQLQVFNGYLRICINGCSVGTTLVNDNNWHLATVVGDGTSIRAYLDGKTTPEITQSAGSATMSGSVTIGKTGGVSSFYFPGQLDDVRVYNYALSADQIKLLYNGDASLRFGQ